MQEMIINLLTTNNARVVSAVLGQMSDGMWENSPGMERYWHNASVEGTDLIILTGYSSGFAGKTEEQIMNYFAKKIKQVVQEEVGSNKRGWRRDNTESCCYMHNIPVCDCYRCYDFLKGRRGHKYGTV